MLCITTPGSNKRMAIGHRQRLITPREAPSRSCLRSAGTNSAASYASTCNETSASIPGVCDDWSALETGTGRAREPCHRLAASACRSAWLSGQIRGVPFSDSTRRRSKLDRHHVVATPLSPPSGADTPLLSDRLLIPVDIDQMKFKHRRSWTSPHTPPCGQTTSSRAHQYL
jgi:hypothetical protein